MGTAQPAFAQSNVCARQTEPGRRHAVMEQRLLRRVDSPSASGSGNMGDLWQCRGWPLRLKRQLSLPDVLFEGHGCVGPRLTQPPPLCISPNRSDPSGHQTNQRKQTQSYFSRPALEEPALVLRAVSAAHRSPLAYSPETGPHLSGEQNDVASPARAVGSAPLATRWELTPRVPRQFRSPSGRWPGPGMASMSSACGLEGFYFLSPGPFSAHGKLDAVIPPP